jgi:hypothetical protein
MPHFENVTQFKADYPAATPIGGHYGVNHEREKGGYQADPFPLPKRTEFPIKPVIYEAVPKLQFWNSNLKIRSFARLKA